MLSSSDVRLGKKLGAGGAGMVYTGFFACGDTAEANVAMKETFNGMMEQETTEILHEVQLLLKLKHRNIVQVGSRENMHAHTLTCAQIDKILRLRTHTDAHNTRTHTTHNTHTHTHTHTHAQRTHNPISKLTILKNFRECNHEQPPR